VYVSFCGVEWSILGRISDASDDVWLEAEVVHSVSIVVLCAMHALLFGRGGSARVSSGLVCAEGF
jgi:hypothetical protein